MSMKGIAPGGCMGDWRRRQRDRIEQEWNEPAPTPAPSTERELSLKKFLSLKGKELVKEGTLESGTPTRVLQDHYRETASEGSGQYDVRELRAAAGLVPVKAGDIQWFDKQMAGAEKEFRDVVLGLIVSDAMSAIGTDPSLAVALSVARK